MTMCCIPYFLILVKTWKWFSLNHQLRIRLKLLYHISRYAWFFINFMALFICDGIEVLFSHSIGISLSKLFLQKQDCKTDFSPWPRVICLEFGPIWIQLDSIWLIILQTFSKLSTIWEKWIFRNNYSNLSII